MKKWVKRIVAGVVILVSTLVFLVLTGSLVARYFAARTADRDFPPPGRVFEIDGRVAHIHCTGTGSPVILLESGLDDRGSWSWAGIREDLTQISRVCAYDRAGILWSEPGEDPRDAERITAELNALLTAAGEAPPYLMVGHSLGGLLMRVYDQRYPGEAAGFVFVDSSHPEQADRFPAEVQETMARVERFYPPRWIFSIIAPYWSIIEHDTPNLAFRWRSLPQLMRENAAGDAIFEQAGRTGSLRARPVVVLTAGEQPPIPGISAQGAAAMQRAWLDLQAELARLSTNSDHRVIEGAGHYIHVDRPETVVDAVRDAVQAVREGGEVRRTEN